MLKALPGRSRPAKTKVLADLHPNERYSHSISMDSKPGVGASRPRPATFQDCIIDAFNHFRQ